MNGDAFDPTTVIVGRLNHRLAAVPFQPFDIVMSNGDRHHVPTPDHITITRRLRRIQIETDAWQIVDINPLHVASIEDHQNAA